jgi:hypothetical protein
MCKENIKGCGEGRSCSSQGCGGCGSQEHQHGGVRLEDLDANQLILLRSKMEKTIKRIDELLEEI